KKVNSVCTGCSKGCNITTEFREGEIVRLKPRYHADVNDFWMCDDGRYGYHHVNAEDRLRIPMKREGDDLVPTGWNAAFDAIKAKVNEHGGDKIAVIASAHGTNEEIYLSKRCASEAVKTSKIGLLAKPITDADVVYPKFTIEKDKNPNRAGASALLGDVPTDNDVWSVLKGAKGAIVFGGVPDHKLDDATKNALAGLDFLVVVDILPTDLSETADYVLPGTAWTEKDGTLTNSQKRTQRIHRALPPLGNALNEWEFLTHAANALGADFDYESVEQITDEIAATVETFANATTDAIGERGYVLGSGEPKAEELTANYAYAVKYWK
ncbi:MAG: molybdopterin-dependent oxidoreductase, partial [Candidatus Poribacteria bacterium]|nr:molybdopterin-dependent oxidoreductase [Candidatus Poribacteria bacterium]